MNGNVGEKTHGFRIDRVREITDSKGVMYEMTHEKTGAQLVWLKRDDENKTFCIGFRTIPEDDSGVFHICEHSVLNGSRKYPVREPFVDLLKSSMQTFLNAMTYPDKTIYPVSSRNPQDFLNLMDVYLDAVLHPSIYTNPNIFYQEGWHYEIRNPEEEPVFKGVVLNEMKGAFSSVDEVIMNETNRSLFPDSCYRFVSGGDPEKITDLSYEQFIAAHSRFYHPSNSRTFLDGDLDIDAALEKIDGFFSEYEKEDLSFEIHPQKILDGKASRVSYEIGAEEDAKDKTAIAFAEIIGGYEDVEKQLAWRVLSTVLAGSNEAPLKKAILAEHLGQDVEVVVIDELLQPYLLLVIRNTNEECLEDIRRVIRSTVTSMVEKGLRREEIKAILNQMEFHYRERKEPAGVMLASASYQSWLYDGDPAMYLSIGNLYESLRNKADQGYFDELLKEGLLEEKKLSVITAVPDAGLAAVRAGRETEKLHAAKLSWGDKIGDYIEKNRILDEWQKSEDTEEMKATLPKLKKSDLSAEPKHDEPTVKEIRSVPVLIYPESASGIVYFNLYFNIAGVTREHLPEIGLLCDVLLRLRTKRHTLPELQEEVRSVIGSLSISPDAFTVNRNRETCYPVITVACSVLKQNLEKAVDLILEILTETVFEKETILPLLLQTKENFRQMFIGGGHAAAVMRAGAHCSAENSCKEAISGYDGSEYISRMCDAYEENYEEIIYNCEMYTQQLFMTSRLTASVSGEDNLSAVNQVLDRLPYGDARRAAVHVPLLTEKNEGIQVPSQVSYAAIGNNLQNFDVGYCGALRLIAQILTYGYLWNEIRVKGGAYGTGFAASPSGNVAAWSYRDPSPEASLEIYRSIADYIESLAESNPDLTSYIIGTIAASEPLDSPARKIRSADARWFSGITYETRKQIRSEILSATPEDLKRLVPPIRSAMAEGNICVVGPAEKQSACGVENVHSIS